MIYKKGKFVKIITLIFFAPLLHFYQPVSAQMSSTNFKIASSVENQAGGAVQSTNFSIEGSVGVAAETGETGSTNYLLNIGFIYQTFFELQPVAEINLPDTSVSAGATIFIPVTVSTDSSIGLAQFVVEFDSSVINFSGAQTGADAAGFLVSTNPNLPFDPAAVGTNKNVLVQVSGGGTNIFTGTNQQVVLLEFDAIAGSGTSPIVFDKITNHTFLTTENLNDLAGALLTFNDGSCAVTPGFTVSGAIQYYANDNGVPNVTVNLDGYSASTDAPGSFVITGVAGGDYSLKPVHQGDLGSSISAYDASFVLRFVAELITFTPYQMLAADVSGNGGVSAFDASYILRYVAGLINEFPVIQEWTFVPADFQIDENNWTNAPDSINYLPLDSDMSNQDFEAIVFGDVSGNWSPPGLELAANQKNVTGNAIFNWGDVVISSEGQFDVPVSMNINGEVYSAEMEICFDTEALSLKKLKLGEQVKDFYLEYAATENVIKLALAGAKPLTSEIEILKFQFELTDPGSPKETAVIINKAVLNEGRILVDLSNNQLSLNPNVPVSTKLFQNYPNPFNPETTIRFQLAERGKIRLKIYNLLGREVRTLMDEEKETGTYSVEWDGRNDAGMLVTSGVYLFRMMTKDDVETKKLIFIR